MRKFLGFVGGLGLLILGSVAQAAQIPLFSGPNCSEPSQLASCLNQTVGQVNTRVNGNLQTLATTAVTSGTSIITLVSAGLPAGFLANNFDGVRIHAWGVNSADANVKTITIAWGAGSTFAMVVTGNAQQWTIDCVIYKTAASVQVGECHGVAGAGGVTPLASIPMTAGAETDTAVIPILIRGTAATAGTITVQGATFEALH